MKNRFTHIFFLVLLTTFLYWDVLSYKYPGCDFFPELYGSIQGVSKFFISSLSGGIYAPMQVYLFRPFSSFILYLNYILSGSDPLTYPVNYQLTMLVLQVIAIILVYFFALSLFKKKSIAFLSGLIFAIWPGNMWVLPAITARHDALIGFFTLLTLIFLDKYLKGNKRKWQVFAIITSFFTYLSKDSGVVLLVLILFYIILNKKEKLSIKGLMKIYLPFVFTLLFYFLLRIMALGSLGGLSGKRTLFETIISRLVLTTSFFERLIYPIDIFGLDKIILFYVTIHDISLLELLAFFIISLVAFCIFLYLIIKIMKNQFDWRGFFTTKENFLLLWILTFLAFYALYGKVSMWYMYIAAIPFSMILSLTILSKNRIPKILCLVLIFYFIIASPIFIDYSSVPRVGGEINKEVIQKIVEFGEDMPSNSTLYLVNYLEHVEGYTHWSGIGDRDTQALLKIKYPNKYFNIIEINGFNIKDANEDYSIRYSIKKVNDRIIIVTEGKNVQFRKPERILVRTEENGKFQMYPAPQKIEVAGNKLKQEISIKNFGDADYILVLGVENSRTKLSCVAINDIQ